MQAGIKSSITLQDNTHFKKKTIAQLIFKSTRTASKRKWQKYGNKRKKNYMIQFNQEAIWLNISLIL